MAWTWGTNTLNPGQSQRWWLWWPGDPGLEIIGVQCITPGAQVEYTTPGMQTNADGSSTYFITVTNTGPVPVQYHFTGSAKSSWIWGLNTLNPGQTQRWWLLWSEYPGVELIGVQAVTPGCEIQVTVPGVQINNDGSATYFVTVTNAGPGPAQYHFRGSAIC